MIKNKFALPKINTDYHVHFGKYFNAYYSPSRVIEALAMNNIRDAWVSSTTSCILWNDSKEKRQIINSINNEFKEAIKAAKLFKINLRLLYWVSLKRYNEGETINSIMDKSFYSGFKIHTKVLGWEKENFGTNNLMNEVCKYAELHNLPILIHTGNDYCERPSRFEKFFAKHPSVIFVLAHCKEPDEIIRILTKYPNVYGDTAFCPKKNIKKISNAKLKCKLINGTDFPITYWYLTKGKCNVVSQQKLNKHYKEIRSKFP